jgi:hypothetical protein
MNALKTILISLLVLCRILYNKGASEIVIGVDISLDG